MAVNHRIRTATRKSKLRSIKRDTDAYLPFIPYYAQRTFIHELGHFIANSINHRCYGMPRVESISIYRSAILSSDYEGDNKVRGKRSRRFDPNVDPLPAEIASLAYGCIFESAYLDMPDLLNCLRTNGAYDNAQRRELVPDPTKWPGLSQLTDAHFAALRSSGLPSFLKSISVSRYIRKGKGGILRVDIRLLMAEHKILMRRYARLYLQLIQQFRAIL